MATRAKAQKTQAQTQGKRDLIKISAGAVSEIKERWSDDNSVLFDCMIYDNVYLYGLTLRFDMDDVPWIAFPSRKGKDGKYYKHYYCEFANDAIDKIVNTLYPTEG